ncbi:hypothetical protein C2S52_010082 [Perilla frutescens var. hirtella]|nr:hypothetical protein C2S52_010082 [Perilla frutescens var. hirtella]
MDSGQGDLEFKTEVLILARLQHNNLVRLLGFSIQGNERLLVYEFVQNGSLDHFLFVLRDATQETSRIIGTYGYMAPEYANHGRFSFKSDMYSFGVVVLEIVSGQKRFQNGATPRDLLNIAWRNWQERTSANIIDPFLMATFGGAQPEMLKCIHIALLCVQENPGDRPTVASVVQMLSTSSSL